MRENSEIFKAFITGVHDGLRRNWHRDAFWGLHYDMHAMAGDMELGGKLTEKHLMDRWKDIKPDWVQCDCKGHPGYTSWPASVGSTCPGLAKDCLEIYRNATKKLDIKLGVHYSGVIDERAIELHPEWACIDENGKRDSRSVCLRGAYLDELMIPQMLEIIEKYDIDGFWVDGDNWGSKPCWCGRCRKEFVKRTSINDIPFRSSDAHWADWLAFHRGLFEEYVKKYTDVVHEKKTDCLICSNWMYTVRQPGTITVPVDYLSGDFTPNNGADRAALEGRFLDSRRMTWDLMAWGFTRNFEVAKSPFCMKTALHLCQETAEVIALGGGVMVYVSPQRNGRLKEFEHKIVRDVSVFSRKRKKYCFKTASASELAILHLAGHYYQANAPLFNLGTAIEPLEGALHALLETHHSADILSHDDALGRLDDYKLIVLPEQSAISEPLRTALLEYVRSGGTVLGTGSAFAEEMGDILGVVPDGKAIPDNVEENTNFPVCFNRKTAISFAGESSWVWGPSQLVKAEKNTRITAYLDNSLASGKSEKKDVIGTKRKYGKGYFAGVYCSLFKTYSQNHYHVLRDFIKSLIDDLGIDWNVQLEAPSWLEMILRKKGSRLMINLINRGSGETLSPKRFIVNELPPVRDIKLNVKAEGKKTKVTVFPETVGFNFKYEKGFIKISLPEVHIHTVITIEGGILRK